MSLRDVVPLRAYGVTLNGGDAPGLQGIGLGSAAVGTVSLDPFAWVTPCPLVCATPGHDHGVGREPGKSSKSSATRIAGLASPPAIRGEQPGASRFADGFHGGLAASSSRGGRRLAAALPSLDRLVAVVPAGCC